MSEALPKISIISCCYNSANTIRETLDSVARQDYPNIEHILVDGMSTDNSMEIIRSYEHVTACISEKDEGMYDAMNKGIQLATGQYVGILNSDDFLSSADTISTLAHTLITTKADAVIGDIKFVRPDNLNKTIRYYSAKNWHPGKFEWGYMPPHPSFYVKREMYNSLGLYKTDYKICADYELLVRYLKVHKITYHYIPECIVTMRGGGISNASLKNRYILNKEIVRACRENGLRTSLPKISLKVFRKLFEYIKLKH
ncbi:MAG: glycosyltransferase [Saprospiraceae bacterium]|nr:glycosyltransferase [Saprospiraceae bacterium]